MYTKGKSIFGADLSIKEKINNAKGISLRTQYKTLARKLSVAGGKNMLNLFEGPVKRGVSYSKFGIPTRFFKTRPIMNVLSKASLALGVAGVVYSVHRVATAKNPLKEARINILG